MGTPGFAESVSGWTNPADRLCVGIDPHPHLLEHWGLADNASGLTEFCTAVTDAVLAQGVHLIKPQVAFFERHGIAGMTVLSELIGSARAHGLIVIADAKRGDVGSTVAAYADAWLGVGGDFESDALTAVAYQGVGSLEPMMQKALEGDKGLFVLSNTSNPEGWLLQGALVSQTTTVAQHVVDDLVERQEASGKKDWLGCVVGATLDSTKRSVSLGAGFPLWILAPGFGAQGARLSDSGQLFAEASSRVIPTVSRSVVSEGRDLMEQAISQHRAEALS